MVKISTRKLNFFHEKDIFKACWFYFNNSVNKITFKNSTSTINLLMCQQNARNILNWWHNILLEGYNFVKKRDSINMQGSFLKKYF